jgi:hypothetical protein
MPVSYHYHSAVLTVTTSNDYYKVRIDQLILGFYTYTDYKFHLSMRLTAQNLYV